MGLLATSAFLVVAGCLTVAERRTLRRGIAYLLLGVAAAVLGLAVVLTAPGCRSGDHAVDPATGLEPLVAAAGASAAVADATIVFAAAPMAVVVSAAVLILNGIHLWRRDGPLPGRVLFPGSLASLAAALALLACLIDPALVWLRSGRTPAPVPGMALMLLAAYLSGCFCALLASCFVNTHRRYRPGPDVVVVLGTGLDNGSVPALLASRLDLALVVFRLEARGPDRPCIVVSGGRGADQDITEASAMSAYLVEHGIPSATIATEDKSTNTRENIRFSKALLHSRQRPYRAVVVTNSFHVFRTAGIVRREGFEADVVGSVTDLRVLPGVALREFSAILSEYRGLFITTTASLAAVFLALILC